MGDSKEQATVSARHVFALIHEELAIHRSRHSFGNTMKARELPLQMAEARIGASAQDQMTGSGMPVSVKMV